MAVKHTVHDPRRAKLHGGPLSESGSGGYDRQMRALAAPPTSAAPSRGLAPVSEEGGRRPSSSSACGHREVALRQEQPWRSEKVAEFAGRTEADSKRQALVLEGPRGIALRAVGEPEDHKVASKVVVGFESRRLEEQHKERRTKQDGQRRNAVPRSSDIALARPPSRSGEGELVKRPGSGKSKDIAFGAVYEYRDSCGTAKVVASTSQQPERQFLLDKRHHEKALSTHKEPALVWVGMSGGSGGLSDAQMTEVRRAVADTRADRLQAKKLSDVKPYSRHG